jgi:hypothetical protein
VLASGGGTLLVVWTDDNEVRATRIHPSFTIDPPVVVSTDAVLFPLHPTVAFNGTHFLIAWLDVYAFDRGYGRPSISGRRVTPGLSLVDTTDLLLVGEASTFLQRDAPSLAAKGSEWFLAYQSRFEFLTPELSLARIAPNGTTTSTSIIGSGFTPELTWSGTTMYVAYRPEGGALRVEPVDGAGLTEQIAGRVSDGRQIGITSRNGQWLAVYARFAETHVPRVFAAIPARTLPRRRAL